MKKNILFILLLTFYSVSSQIAVFHPVQVPSDQVEKFEKVQTEYVQKIAQDAVDKGNLGAWALLKAFNSTSEDYNYLWVHLYQDVDQVVDKFSWWANSEEVLGIKPDILYGDIDTNNLDEVLNSRAPYPGGVGPITVSSLFLNLSKLIKFN